MWRRWWIDAGSIVFVGSRRGTYVVHALVAAGALAAWFLHAPRCAQARNGEEFALLGPLLSAQEAALAAERGARLAERAAQRIGDAIRAERRAAWLVRSAESLRTRGGREYFIARRGSDLARSERDAIVHEARSLVRRAVAELDTLLGLPDSLRLSAGEENRRLPAHAAQQLVEAATRVRAAATSVREALYEVQAVHVRAELLRPELSGEQGQRMEESFTRRRAELLEAITTLTAAGELLSQGARNTAEWVEHTQAMRLQPRRTNGLGLGVGVGVGVQIDVGGKRRVESASIAPAANGSPIVLVEYEPDVAPHIVLEAHYFLPALHPQCASTSCVAPTDSNGFCRWCASGVVRRMRWGPFVAIRPGDDFVDAVGIGWLFGWSVEELHKRGSINLGVAYVADPNTRVLEDGFRAGESPPPGATQVRFQRVTKFGVLVLLTYGF